ncbi:hypothetical protein [Rhizobium leguminosarum]|uniref:hypothetical protein n=1 Tax=Rhizobium leguminosarum TaxID=384 RepID=UPI001FEDD90B|nr:hypothetical protein [Rhizobium leguminosarum]
MIRKILLAAVALSSMLFWNTTQAQEITYTPVPPGFDFPADERALLDALSGGDEVKLRTHAWMIFAGLTQKTRPNDPNSEAIWETWYTGDDVFSAGAAPQVLRTLKRELVRPRQFSPHGSALPQSIGESQLSFTLFNQELKDHTRSEKLNLSATMKAINDGWTTQTPVEDRKVKDYPREAMSLKMIWMPVAKSGMTSLPIWDELPIADVVDALPAPTWKRRVAVDPSRDSIPDDEVVDLPGFPRTHVVPLKAFYYFQLNAEQAQKFDDAAEGDYAVLVAMHYTTKEIPNWVWATFWWHDQPNAGPYAANRPDETKVSGPWRNYLMDVAYDMDLPTESNATPNAVFNPWLEAKFPNGVNSNCMTCHQRAVWTELGDVDFLPVTRGPALPNDPIFINGTKADFLWSLLFEGNQ